MSAAKKLYTASFPTTLMGAMMYHFPKGASVSDIDELSEVSFGGDDYYPSSIGITTTCEGGRKHNINRLADWECEDEGLPHSHIRVSCDDGIGFIGIKVESREMLRQVLMMFPVVDNDWIYHRSEAEVVCEVLLRHADHLAEELTESERSLLEDTDISTLVKKHITGYFS